ncbi:MAG: AIR synthase-related protein, partial [candidate division KSB1 bacterium]
FGKLNDAMTKQLVRTMTRLNRRASEAMIAVGAHAATDITGFGLVGHAHELAHASRVTFRIAAREVPILPEALHYAREGCLTAGERRNGEFVQEHLHVSPQVDALLLSLFKDPQTAGGLLISMPRKRVQEFFDRLGEEAEDARQIGEVAPRGKFTLEIEL